MFFSHIARIAAFLVLVVGALRAGVGFAIASGWIGPSEVALSRFGGAATTTGEMIDSGFLAVGIAIALGTLAEISLGLRKRD